MFLWFDVCASEAQTVEHGIYNKNIQQNDMHELCCVCAPAFNHDICGSKCRNFVSMLKTIIDKYSHDFK